jgi:hypothetical protein
MIMMVPVWHKAVPLAPLLDQMLLGEDAGRCSVSNGG